MPTEMKSMSFGSLTSIKPSFSSSSSKYSLLASGHGEVIDFSRVGDHQYWKSIKINNTSSDQHSTIQSAAAAAAGGGGSWLIMNCRCQVMMINNASIYQQRKPKFLTNASSSDQLCHHAEHDDDDDDYSQINGKSLKATFHVIYKYSRLYTLKGTAVIGGCLANLYVVGLNQLSDIEIDKVNKPHLPLASGELAIKTGVLVTSLYAILWSIKSWPLKLSLFFWFAIGSAYSVNLPLLRWKRFPVVVTICALSFQGVILPMLFHLHAQTYIHGITSRLSKHAIFVFGIMSVYTAVLSTFKDIPDVEGDKLDGIKSFPSILGPKRVFWICIWLLEMVYGIAVLIGLSSTRFWIRLIMVSSHGILGFILWRKANLVDLKSNEAIESFYLFIWKLYYAEYLLVPILRF